MIRPLDHERAGMVGGATLHQLRAWILAEPTRSQVTIWGLSTRERLRRALLAAGLSSDQISVGSTVVMSGQEDFYLLVRSEYVFDDRLIRALVAAPDTILMANGEVVAAHVRQSRCQDVIPLLSSSTATFLSSPPLSGVQTVTPLELAPAYTATLRKADPPYVLPASSSNLDDIEARIFAAAYKGVTDLVTKWVWPKPARAVTRRLAYAGVHPNVVTLLSWALVVLAIWLFARGAFGLGLVVAWIMTFLDTVDGKLARVTLTSSTIGHVLDHSLDLVHPPFWYLAWAFGLFGDAFWLDASTIIIVTGYLAGRLIEGLFLLAFKMEMHCWRPLDSFFRTITARRNPNLILLTLGTLSGRPDWGFFLVAAWTICSIGFHAIRLLQAGVLSLRGHPIEEWQGKTLSPLRSAQTSQNTTNRSESPA